MLKRFFRDRILWLLLIGAIGLRFWSASPFWVEKYYSGGIYPGISRFLRVLTGWAPFSLGDFLYAAAFIYLFFLAWKLVRLLRQRALNRNRLLRIARKSGRLALAVYLVFNLFWGLNYNRRGIAAQLDLDVQPYTKEELLRLALVMKARLNDWAARSDSVARQRFDQTSVLFREGTEAYRTAARAHSWLNYRSVSLKPSLYTHLGHYFGFTGYYNPFSGEAQVKTTIPVFLKPFVITHEIAHQLGYAKEDEASFVAFLACRTVTDPDFRYSVYFELYRDVLWQCLRSLDRETVMALRSGLHPRVLSDQRTLRLYLSRSRNSVEPIMSDFYDRYLKLNNQPKGLATYNEVVAMLVALMKKEGEEGI